MRAKIPVISVDTRRRELVGAFHNKGRRWGKKQKLVNTYDFPSLAEGRAYPYGLCDEVQNEGFVNVGVSHDTAEFAVESIDRWWRMLGCRRYPNANKLLITADGGGSNRKSESTVEVLHPAICRAARVGRDGVSLSPRNKQELERDNTASSPRSA